MVKLGKVTVIYTGTGFPKELQGCKEGKYPFYKVGDISKNVLAGYKKLMLCDNYIEEGAVKKIKGKILPKDTVVFAKIGEAVKLNRRAITTKECLVDNNVMGIAPVKSFMDINYLYYYMSFVKLENLAEATTVPSVKKGMIEDLEIDLPTLDTQRIISNIISEVDDLILLINKQLDDLNVIVKSRFIEMFGDPAINPYSYPVKSIADIADYWNGLTYKPDDVSVNGTIVLRSSNIQDGKLDFKDIVRVTCKIGEKKYVKINDILMCSRNGSAKLVGKVALIDSLIEPMCFGAFMMIIRSDYYPYLLTYFNTEAFRRQLSVGATTTINQITGNMLSQIKLPVPPVEQVKEYLSFMTQVDKSKLAIQQSLDELETLKKSLMQQYFG